MVVCAFFSPVLKELIIARTDDSQLRFARIDLAWIIRNWLPYSKARQADSHESLELPIRANHLIRANHATKELIKIMSPSRILLNLCNFGGRLRYKLRSLTKKLIPQECYFA